jgi:hypothetical protein
VAELPYEAPKILAIYLQIANYPILAQEIRRRMRAELFRRGIITPESLEKEVREKAILSQRREGVAGQPGEDEPHWEQRRQTVQDYLTDFYFAYNFPLDLFQSIVVELLVSRSVNPDDLDLHFNPELAPLELLLKQASDYEALPEVEREKVRHHLEEIIVVLIKTMISDHLDFIRISKAWFTAEDLRFIQSRRIGTGKIGGKAAGLLLAWKILQAFAPLMAQQIVLPESYFIGTDVFYDFLSFNRLEYYIDQKYKSLDQIRQDYPAIQAIYEQGRFPDDVVEELRAILQRVGKKPLIVRSSSLLEDKFGTSFAGKYDSHFCPNQGTVEENLAALMLAIRRTYASASNPDALLYRRRMGLLDYDERMAILLQEVQGQVYGRYFFPSLAGVGFSRTPILWHPRLRREDGFVRLVLGLGTRAVNRVADDYPRLINLSHPMLRPEGSLAAMRRYSQHFIDVIDLEANELVTLPVEQVIGLDYPPLRWVVSVDDGDTLMPVVSLGPGVSPRNLVLTFDTLLQRSDFVPHMKSMLSVLSRHYEFPVDVEFAVSLTPASPRPKLTFHLLQCRPQSSARGEKVRPVPTDVPDRNKVFVATRMVPQGMVSCVEYLIYVDESQYGQLADPLARHEVARYVGLLDKKLEKHNFIMLGPGRWGSTNPDLGVPVTYADICNSCALVELSVAQQGLVPEPSYGTHFFQDLVEAEIYPLAVYPEEPGDYLNLAFLDGAQNHLETLLPEAARYSNCIKVIHVPSEREGQYLEIVMDGERALAYIARPGEDLTAAVSPPAEAKMLVYGPEW